MIRRPLAATLWITLALAVSASGMAGADHAPDFLDDVRQRFVELREALVSVAERASEGEPDGVQDGLERAQTRYEAARDDIRDLAPQQAERLAAFFDGLASAVEEDALTDVTALARSAAQAMADVLETFDAYAEVGTTVEVESAELNAGASTMLALFVRDVPSGLAGYEIDVHFDPEQIRIDEASLETGRGATRVEQASGTVSFNGVAVEVASQRAPPDVLALGTFKITAIGDPDTDAALRTDIREIVDLEGNRLRALDRDGAVTIR